MLELSSVSIGYKPIKVVKDINIKVERGKIVTLIGPNGAGKTTTLKGIVGLADIFFGSIKFDGISIVRQQPEEIARKGIILVPDDRKLFLDLSCEENLELGAYSREARRHFSDSLDIVYTLFPVLKEKRRQLAKTLSGGEQQMLAIGRGIMARPKILLIDEPSTGLSPKLVLTLLKTLALLREKGFSILFSEQNVYGALECSDKAYLLVNGEVKFQGLSSEIYSSDLIRRYFGELRNVVYSS